MKIKRWTMSDIYEVNDMVKQLISKHKLPMGLSNMKSCCCVMTPAKYKTEWAFYFRWGPAKYLRKVCDRGYITPASDEVLTYFGFFDDPEGFYS